MMKVSFILIFTCVAAVPPRNSIENEIVGEPTVDCEESLVGLTFKTKKPFSGRVYVYGMAGDEKCSRTFVENRNRSRISIIFKNGDCTMQRQRISGQVQGLITSTVIVVSFHGTFVTKADRAYKCVCYFRSQKSLRSSIEMSPIATTELLNTLPTPSCTYSIHTHSPDGAILMTGTVGEKIYHVWQCDSLATGFLVHTCSVGDGRGERVDLIDVDGCAVDPAIQPDVSYDTNNRAVVEVSGYKFSDASVLNYECVLEVCRSTLECAHITPPKCQRDNFENGIHQGPLRRSRSVVSEIGLKRGQIDVAATLTMEDALEASSVTSESTLPLLDGSQLNPSLPLLSQTICLPTISVLFTVALFGLVFVSSVLSVFYIARYHTYVVNPK